LEKDVFQITKFRTDLVTLFLSEVVYPVEMIWWKKLEKSFFVLSFFLVVYGTNLPLHDQGENYLEVKLIIVVLK
jgi:hypothetical protein